MGQGISEVLPFAIGVAISPIPIVAVIAMLFSQRARANGPAFLLGWVIGLSVLSGVVYAVAHAAHVATDSTASDSTSTGQIVLGVVLLLAAGRRWRARPAPGTEPQMPKWMARVDDLTPPQAFGFGVLLSAVNPKNLILTLGAASGLAQLGLSNSDAVFALAVFVAIASVSVAGAVAFYFVGGERAQVQLVDAKSWLALHNSAVMATLFLVFGAVLISKGLGPLTA